VKRVKPIRPMTVGETEYFSSRLLLVLTTVWLYPRWATYILGAVETMAGWAIMTLSVEESLAALKPSRMQSTSRVETRIVLVFQSKEMNKKVGKSTFGAKASMDD
jgi:hypothetical protein